MSPIYLYMDGKNDNNLPPVTLSDEDMSELKEVIVEFLALNEYLYHKRVQKLVFAGEIKSAQKTGHRLTDASFCPYNYGPYSQAVEQALNKLAEEGRVERTWSPPNKERFQTTEEGGELSPRKKYIVEQSWEDYMGVPTEDIVADVKDTWVYEAFEDGEEIDFAQYIDEFVRPPSDREVPEEKNPIPEEETREVLKS